MRRYFNSFFLLRKDHPTANQWKPVFITVTLIYVFYYKTFIHDFNMIDRYTQHALYLPYAVTREVKYFVLGQHVLTWELYMALKKKISFISYITWWWFEYIPLYSYVVVVVFFFEKAINQIINIKHSVKPNIQTSKY